MGKAQVFDEVSSISRQQLIIDGLVRHGFSVMPDYFVGELVAGLHEELLGHLRDGHLQGGHIGKGRQRVRIAGIRGDSILWIDGASAAQRAFLDEMELLRQEINRQLFLSLEELETHFAYYPPGTGYQKHRDSFQNDNPRRISFAVYLNPAWQCGDGGELLIFRHEEVIAQIPPRGGTLVCFVSEEFPHQVAVTRSGRASIAGWFRVREIGAVPVKALAPVKSARA